MEKVLILVEGQTEERFVKDVLEPYLRSYDVAVIPTILNTKIVKHGPNFKGGITSYAKLKRDTNNLLSDTSSKFITTMVDYYGITEDFPGYSNTNPDCYQRVQYIEEQMREDINHPNFLPYLQLHEFESLLFSDINKISETFPSAGIREKRALESIVNSFGNPELINNSRVTAPSKRLLNIYPTYNKTVFGAIISSKISIDEIINHCPHFAQWINTLRV